MLDPLGWSRFTGYIALHLVSLPGPLGPSGPVDGCAGGRLPGSGEVDGDPGCGEGERL